MNYVTQSLDFGGSLAKLIPQGAIQFFVTGSDQILMDKNIKESLAGRASFLKLNTLSVSEILAFKEIPIQEILYRGGWPDLYANENQLTRRYLDNYISSYIEKDIVLTAGIQKQREFTLFIKLLAGRVGELLDYASLSKEVGVDSKTIKEWISVLEKMQIIYLVQPYFSNLSKRLIKSPKIYFVDTGLACRLQGWTSHEPILTSPQQGHLFENLVFGEIYKTILNHDLDYEIFHWRTRDGGEIDFLLKLSPSDFLFLEAKTTPRPTLDPNESSEIKKVFKGHPPKILLIHQNGEISLGKNVPLRNLKKLLL